RIVLQEKNTDSSHILRISDRAKQRFQRWKEQPPFDKGDHFARRLVMDSLNEDDLLTLLDEPIEAMQAHNVPPPTWLIERLTAFTDQNHAANFTLPLSTTGQGTHTMAFLNTLNPLLSSELDHIHAAIH